MREILVDLYDMIILYFLIFLLGASFASFFCALAYRIESEMKYPDLLTKGSHCERCGKQLRWFELIPVLSFLISKGRCAKCGNNINPVYFVAELLTGAIALTFYLNSVEPLYYLFGFSLGFLAIYDAMYKGVPKNVMHIYLVLGVIYLFSQLVISHDVTLLYPLIISGGLYMLVEIINRWKLVFGRGDTLLIVFLSTVTSLQLFLSTLLFAFLIGGVVSIVLLLMKWSKRGSYIPFIPFIALGYISAVLLSAVGITVFDYIYLLW